MQKKKFITWLLACACVTAMGAAATACGTDEDSSVSSSSSSSSITDDSSSGYISEEEASKGLEYTLSEDGVQYAVTGIGSCTDTDIIIPSTYNGLPVKSIGDEAFYECSSLTSIVIPDSLTSIAWEAFYGCSSLQYNEKGGLKYLGNKNNPYLCLMWLIETETTDITTVTIDNSCKVIADAAFFDCGSLTSINVSENNETYKSINGNLYSKDGKTLIQYAIGKTATEFTIPDSVACIGDFAFGWCENLTSVVIPDRVTSIGDCVFIGCSGLTSIIIPDGVTNIGVRAFYGCSGLTSIIIPDGVTSIGGLAFYDCSSLTSVTIGNGVMRIGVLTFYKCNMLNSVYYKGTESDWSEISIEGYNTALTNSTKYYYSEAKPTSEGNYWHYDENGNVAVW